MNLRQRKGKRGRFPIQPNISFTYKATSLVPYSGGRQANPIHIELAELEAIRLCDYEGLEQKQAAIQMQVSRGTVWRLLQSGRKKLIGCIVEDQILVIHRSELKEIEGGRSE